MSPSPYMRTIARQRPSRHICHFQMPLGGEARVCAQCYAVFGLYVDGLEKHLVDTAELDAATLMGVMALLLLYADDHILMCESAAGQQKQLDVQGSFCKAHQLTVKPQQEEGGSV